MSLKRDNEWAWFVACPQFIEPLLADELTGLGAQNVKIGRAGVAMTGDLAIGYQVALWSRLASRLTLVLAEGEASNAKTLSQLILSINWSDHLLPKGTLSVRFFGRNDEFRNTQFGAQWVKDQVVDYFHDRFGVRPDVSKDPDLTLVVNLHKGRASVGIELNGQSLHHRGYRAANAAAPLRENLAAAVLTRAGWQALLNQYQQRRTQGLSPTYGFIDPMCGSGTLMIEAALMAYDWAPGLTRESSVAEKWLGHDAELWQSLVADAEARKERALAETDTIEFHGNDQAETVFSQARTSWRTLGLPEARWTRSDIAQMPEVAAVDAGLVVSNPPYGERLGSPDGVATLYRALGQWMLSLPAGYQGALLLADAASVADTGLFYDKNYRLLNGDIECRVYTFPDLEKREQKVFSSVPDLANRIRKNLRKLKPFLRSDVTDAYRIYDADLPEYAVAVDRYGDWLHVQEYAPPSTIPEHTAEQRLQQAITTLSEVLDIPRDRIAVKQRRRQKGSSQYEKQSEQAALVTVHEHGVKLKANLTEYLDTGVFLDHRPTRLWLQQNARDKQVLNLFCYTGAASVHAAVGGAARVDSVDLSSTYLNWAQDNFRLNHVTLKRHQFVQADVLAWLADCSERYDLIFLDPPTFSNSKRMEDDFDVQRDHPWLIAQAMRCLATDGTLVFSNNYRRFQMAAELAADFDIKDIRKQSLPPDFQRHERVHGCWLIRHKGL